MEQWRINTTSKPGAPALPSLRGRHWQLAQNQPEIKPPGQEKGPRPQGARITPIARVPRKFPPACGLRGYISIGDRPLMRTGMLNKRASTGGGGGVVLPRTIPKALGRAEGVKPVHAEPKMSAVGTSSRTKSRKYRRWELTYHDEPKIPAVVTNFIHAEPEIGAKVSPARLS